MRTPQPITPPSDITTPPLYAAIVIGVSTGGLSALSIIVESFPAHFSLPIIVVQHLLENSSTIFPECLSLKTDLRVKEADDKEAIEGGILCTAPPGYHLLVEQDRSFGLSVDDKVRYSRPSIDVLFDSAAEAYGKSLIGVILTGANADGSQGLHTVKERGGMTIVQDPATAEAASMPEAAIATTTVDYVLPL